LSSGISTDTIRNCEIFDSDFVFIRPNGFIVDLKTLFLLVEAAANNTK